MRRALFLIGLLLLAGCGAEGDETFDKSSFDITFDYPGDMEEAKNVNLSSGAGGSARATEGLGFTKKDVLIVQRYDLNRAIGKDELDLAKNELDAVVAQIAPGAPSGDKGTTGGFPSLSYEDIEVRRFKGAKTKLVALFDDDTEYLFNCQYTPERKDDVLDACDKALETVKKK